MPIHLPFTTMMFPFLTLFDLAPHLSLSLSLCEKPKKKMNMSDLPIPALKSAELQPEVSSFGPADTALWSVFGDSNPFRGRRSASSSSSQHYDTHDTAGADDVASNDSDGNKQIEPAAKAVLDFYQERILRVQPQNRRTLPGNSNSAGENNAAVIPRTLGNRPIDDYRQGNDWRHFMDIKIPADGSCIGFIIALSWADQEYGYQKGHFGINKASVIPPLAPRPRRWELVACELPSSSSSLVAPNGEGEREESNQTKLNALLASLPETPVLPYPPRDPAQPNTSTQTHRRGGLMLRNFQNFQQNVTEFAASNTLLDDDSNKAHTSDTVTQTQPPPESGLYRYLPLHYSVGDGGGHELSIQRCEVVAFRHCLPSRHAVWHWMWHFQQVKQIIEQQRQNQTVVAAPPSNGNNIINLFFKSRIEIDSFTSLMRGISTRLPNEVLIDVCEYIEGPRHGNNSVVEYARHLISNARFVDGSDDYDDSEDSDDYDDSEDDYDGNSGTTDRPRLYVVDFKDLINPVQNPFRQH